MPKSPPLQKRAGLNQGELSEFGRRVRYMGQPAIKAGPQDTVIFKNSPDIPGRGQKNVRSQMQTSFAAGIVFNRTGGEISYDLILVDPDKNEFRFYLDQIAEYSGWDFGRSPLPDGQNNVLLPYSYFGGASGGEDSYPLPVLPPNWSLVLRVLSGNPTNGKGLIVWPWAQDMSRNIQALIVPVTVAGVELGPPPGRAWQAVGSKKTISPAGPMYLNFDSVDRTVEREEYYLAGETILVNDRRGEITVETRESFEEGFVRGFLTELEEFDGEYTYEFKKPKGIVLAYPDKIRVKAKEPQVTAPLYMLVPFAEFDLPSDMHVEDPSEI